MAVLAIAIREGKNRTAAVQFFRRIKILPNFCRMRRYRAEICRQKVSSRGIKNRLCAHSEVETNLGLHGTRQI